ncbi:hypothetical protein N8Z70_04155, partial [Candidatus Puniceispirillum sp.]|nr:hypothetical protein [Candidatus Puniceispirillum sp.]
ERGNQLSQDWQIYLVMDTNDFGFEFMRQGGQTIKILARDQSMYRKTLRMLTHQGKAALTN